MVKILLLILSFISLCANDIQIEHTKSHPFGTTLEVNAKIIQLSNQKQHIVSRLGGHLEHYYVQAGKSVKKGDKIAKISSLKLSSMSASYISLNTEINVAKIRLSNTQKLYKKGLSSMQDLSTEQMAVANIQAKRDSLKSQLDSLEIDTKTIKKATDTFIIYAHADGKVEQLLVNLHANLDAQMPIISLVKESGYYAEAYLPVESALEAAKDIKASLSIGKKSYACKYISLLPHVDSETGQAKMLFWIESGKDMLLLDAFTKMQIVMSPTKHLVAIKQTAVSMFEGEWVVFVSNEEDEHDEHAEHDDDKEASYTPIVIKILQKNGDFIAVEGIKEGEEYVSSGVYFVKSMLLKSRLGGHGH